MAGQQARQLQLVGRTGRLSAAVAQQLLAPGTAGFKSMVTITSADISAVYTAAAEDLQHVMAGQDHTATSSAFYQ